MYKDYNGESRRILHEWAEMVRKAREEEDAEKLGRCKATQTIDSQA